MSGHVDGRASRSPREPTLRDYFGRRWLRVDRAGIAWSARGPRWLGWVRRHRVAGVMVVAAYLVGRLS